MPLFVTTGGFMKMMQIKMMKTKIKMNYRVVPLVIL